MAAFSNKFDELPTWNYPTMYDIYCTGNNTIPGKKNYFMGSIYVGQYLFYLFLYVPSLIVISRPSLFKYAGYKLMFIIGILDNLVGSMFTFMGGIFSLIGANYCDNNRILIIIGHMAHGFWASYCMTCVILAINRCVEINSRQMAEVLFSGNRVWIWMIAPLLYGIIFSSSIDLPPIYNSVWSVYLFQIDMTPGALPVTDWTCFLNSCWVICSLIILYSILIFSLKCRTAGYASDEFGEPKCVSNMQKKVMFQSFLICLFVFLVAITYAAAGFIKIHPELAKVATISIQMCSGFTSIVYLVINKTIRKGVVNMLLQVCYRMKCLGSKPDYLATNYFLSRVYPTPGVLSHNEQQHRLKKFQDIDANAN